MYHIFFIHSSVDGHLGCFHVLVIVNSAAVNIGVHVSFLSMVFSGYMPRIGIAGSYVFVFFFYVFSRNNLSHEILVKIKNSSNLNVTCTEFLLQAR